MRNFLLLLLILIPFNIMAQSNSTFKTSIGDVKLTLIGHGSVMIEFDNKIIQVDPYSEVADYSQLPKADLILITHEHYDQLTKQRKKIQK